MVNALASPDVLSATMMARESGPPQPRSLNENTLASLRTVLSTYLDPPHQCDELGDVLKLLANEARAKDIRPEHMLVTLKEIWYELPAVTTTVEPAQQARLLQQVVTLCIDHYFAD